MKTIGMIGGMSWESSAEYYRLINETVQRRLGGFHSASSVLVSVDFADIEELQRADEWGKAGALLGEAAQGVERAGADLVLLCTNTMHRVADEVAAAVSIPFLHIADATAGRIRAADVQRVGLLGTRYTMEQEFYRGRLTERHGLQVLVPDEPDRTRVHEVIYQELVLGRIEERSRASYGEIIQGLVAAGAEAIILGCTEIGLLVRAEDIAVPVFDTTRVHAETAVDWALQPFA